MVDPSNITNYNMTEEELEEFILFWVCAAGKNGSTAARRLEVFLTMIIYNNMSPFEAIRNKCTDDIIEENSDNYRNMSQLMKLAGIGCYNHKSRTFTELAHSNINLKTCDVEDLEKIYGIGMKTSRCFVIHSRRNSDYAGLDTHILKHLRESGIGNVPKSTPTSKKQYKRLEEEFLNLAYNSGMSVADYDLKIWNKYVKRRV